ncbi:hypothetical protein RB595_003369 [Gaeumannomyces hyphopodioides]
MASLHMSQEDLKSLESARQKLATLVASITSMRDGILQSNPLPAPTSLETSAFILQKNVESFLRVATDNDELFRRVVVHPSTNFPGRQYEGILGQLLRKKLEPDVETSVEDARAAAAAAGLGPHSFLDSDGSGVGGGGGKSGGKGGRGGANGRGGRGGGGGLYGDDDEDDDDEYSDDDDDDDEGGYRGPEDDDDMDDDMDAAARRAREPLGLGDVWLDARVWIGRRIQEFVTREDGMVYTPQERAGGVENVRTGLRRALPDVVDGDDDDDDDEEEEDEDVPLQQQQQQQQQQQKAAAAVAQGPAVDPEVVLWFMARGDMNLPPNVERLSDIVLDGGKRQRRPPQ